MGLFDKIGDAKAKVQANYFRAGHYIVRINAVLLKENRHGEDLFIIECTVLHVYDDDDGKGHTVGEDVSQAIKMKDDMALPNVKRFLMSILECEEDAVTSQVCERVVSKKQPLAGVIAEVQNRMTVTKKGNDFTEIGWRRTVPAKVLLEELDESVINRYFEEGELEEMLERESEAE